MKTGIWASVALVIILIAIFMFHDITGMSNPKPPPAARAQGQAAETNVDLREHVDDVFQRADARAQEGKIDEAISLYQKGLQVAPWRLEYQLKLARLLQQVGLTEQAVEKAQVVRQYAEQGELIALAEQFLRDVNVPPSNDEPPILAPTAASAEIVLVPIDKVDARLLEELRESLQSRLGLQFTIAANPLSLGGLDRTNAEQLVTRMLADLKQRMPEQRYKLFLEDLGFTEGSLQYYHPRLQVLEKALRDFGCSQRQIYQFRHALQVLQSTGQYDAAKLLAELKKAHPLQQTGPVKGYLGVAAVDLFTRDYDFLYGWGGRGHAVMSYHRYTAAFNDEPPSRPRLLERTIKQGISSTFRILDIPACTSPACARAYVHGLAEHDQKTSELCRDCQRALALALARSR